MISTIKSTAPTVNVTFLQCDLGDRESVKRAMAGFTSDRLDVYLAAAGIMAVPPGLSADGYEIQFGTNHMGHATLMKLVLPVMLRTAEQPGSDVRFISVTSQGYGGHPSGGIVFDTLRTTQENLFGGTWSRYGQSKLANILYAREMARRYPGITSVSIHPGVVKTGLIGNLGFANKAFVYVTSYKNMLSPEEGAYNTLWAATSPKAGLKQGQYYEPVGIAKGGYRAFNDDGTLAGKLWDWTEKELTNFGN